MTLLRRSMAALALSTLLATTAAAGDRADFSGSWSFDPSASQTLDAVFQLQGLSWIKRKAGEGLDKSVVITQTDSQLVATYQNMLGKNVTTLWFDGAAHDTSNPAGVEVNLTTRWDGDSVLVSTGSAEFEGTPGVVTERRSVDGDTMTLVLSMETEKGAKASARRVFRRAE